MGFLCSVSSSIVNTFPTSSGPLIFSAGLSIDSTSKPTFTNPAAISATEMVLGNSINSESQDSGSFIAHHFRTALRSEHLPQRCHAYL